LQFLIDREQAQNVPAERNLFLTYYPTYDMLLRSKIFHCWSI